MEDLKQSYEIDPANVDTLFLISFALLTASDLSRIKHYIDSTEPLLDANDEYVISKFNLIKTVFLNRDYEEGLMQSKRLHVVYPDDYDIFFMVFFCLESLPSRVRALENFITPPAPPWAERIMAYQSTPMMMKIMR